MSTGMFQSLSDPTLTLQNVPYDICAANGRCLEVQGMVKLELTIGPLWVEQDIIVANIQVDMILGMDFLSRHGCKVDITVIALSCACGRRTKHHKAAMIVCRRRSVSQERCK